MELAEVLADIAADVAGRTELEIWQLEELEAFNSLRLPVVLLLAVRCWDSLKS